MTVRTNARVAGFTFLLYIVAGIASMGYKPAAATLTLVTSLCALVLAVTLYALTRGVDADLALLALTCRVVEAVPGHQGPIFFAIGSTIFAWLFLRGRLIPAAIAWLGIVASALLVVVIPLQQANWNSTLTWLIWMPALVFEIALAVWLLTKGVANSAASRA
jgi:Domain of unknown function (DUF4386)